MNVRNFKHLIILRFVIILFTQNSYTHNNDYTYLIRNLYGQPDTQKFSALALFVSPSRSSNDLNHRRARKHVFKGRLTWPRAGSHTKWPRTESVITTWRECARTCAKKKDRGRSRNEMIMRGSRLLDGPSSWHPEFRWSFKVLSEWDYRVYRKSLRVFLNYSYYLKIGPELSLSIVIIL